MRKRFLLIIFLLALSCAASAAYLDAVYLLQPSYEIGDIVDSIISFRNLTTKLSPSHLGHPGYENLAFLYDKAIDAIILNSTGHRREAQEILDYFADRLKMPKSKIAENADANNVYGITKLIKNGPRQRNYVKALINTVDVANPRSEGKSQLEFWSTPGPASFLIYAMLSVDPIRYKEEALTLGRTLLAMQGPDGGIFDGDRAPTKVHTEPHVDACAAFLMLYEITGDLKWFDAAQRAYRWFTDNVYRPEEGIIEQGIWDGAPSGIYAEDCYSWTMAGPLGDKMALEEIRRLTETMLRRSLVKVAVALPNSGIKSVVLMDFSDPSDEKVKKVRDGFHPLGTVEWTAGAVLALQKNAVRFWNGKEKNTAGFYKALAEILLGETMRCFYTLDKEKRKKITFYATGQGIEVGPFGSITSNLKSGWKTPYYYIVSAKGNEAVKGGSLVGAWPILPYLGVNPFILNDRYKEVYDKIPLKRYYIKSAASFIRDIVLKKSYSERIPEIAPLASTQIVEPSLFNQEVWRHINSAYEAKRRRDPFNAEAHFICAIEWATRTVSDPVWRRLAIKQNEEKKRAYGGIIYYPWGSEHQNNLHPCHTAILHYPLLNEIGVSVWALATAYYEIGNIEMSKYWIKVMIEEVPLHQIAVTDGEKNGSITGYWNALISWEENPSNSQRDEEIGRIYKTLLKENNLANTKPKVVQLN